MRWLAGGSYLDIGIIHGVGKTTLYKLIDHFIDDFLELNEYNLKFPIGPDRDDLRDKIESDFAALSGGLLRGCLGALDGIVVAIKKPENISAKDAKNRKGYFAFVVQAICDANKIFT